MTESREFYAATVDDAVEKAAAAAGVTTGELEYDILDEGSSGFLGIGARDARILARGFEASAEPATDGEDFTFRKSAW